MTVGRDSSLDAFRGLTVVAMILVNVQGAPPAAYAWLTHAEWHGMTPADLVFPWFLLIVGLSIPLAIDGRAVPALRIVRRAALLFAIGVVLALLIRPRFEPEQIRWMGVLQRIGIVYLAAALFARTFGGWRAPALAAAVLMTAHLVLLTLPAPGAVQASLAPGEGMAGWLDRALLPGRIYRTTWDPEGVLSTLSATASVLIGVATMRWLRTSTRDPLGIAIALGVAGGIGALIVPLNKALWTPGFALLTAGLGLALWHGMRRMPISMPRVLVAAGQAALTLYIVHMLVLAILVRKLPDGGRVWDATFAPFAAIGPSQAFASLAYAAVVTAACLWTTHHLAKRGWVVKL